MYRHMYCICISQSADFRGAGDRQAASRAREERANVRSKGAAAYGTRESSRLLVNSVTAERATFATICVLRITYAGTPLVLRFNSRRLRVSGPCGARECKFMSREQRKDCRANLENGKFPTHILALVATLRFN